MLEEHKISKQCEAINGLRILGSVRLKRCLISPHEQLFNRKILVTSNLFGLQCVVGRDFINQIPSLKQKFGGVQNLLNEFTNEVVHIFKKEMEQRRNRCNVINSRNTFKSHSEVSDCNRRFNFHKTRQELIKNKISFNHFSRKPLSRDLNHADGKHSNAKALVKHDAHINSQKEFSQWCEKRVLTAMQQDKSNFSKNCVQYDSKANKSDSFVQVAASPKSKIRQVHKNRLKTYFHGGAPLQAIKKEPEETNQAENGAKKNEKRKYVKDTENARLKNQCVDDKSAKITETDSEAQTSFDESPASSTENDEMHTNSKELGPLSDSASSSARETQVSNKQKVLSKKKPQRQSDQKKAQLRRSERLVKPPNRLNYH
jgi:hypothetical protein